jgi:hypothetical protein
MATPDPLIEAQFQQQLAQRRKLDIRIGPAGKDFLLELGVFAH